MLALACWEMDGKQTSYVVVGNSPVGNGGHPGLR